MAKPGKIPCSDCSNLPKIQRQTKRSWSLRMDSVGRQGWGSGSGCLSDSGSVVCVESNYLKKEKGFPNAASRWAKRSSGRTRRDEGQVMQESEGACWKAVVLGCTIAPWLPEEWKLFPLWGALPTNQGFCSVNMHAPPGTVDCAGFERVRIIKIYFPLWSMLGIF